MRNNSKPTGNEISLLKKESVCLLLLKTKVEDEMWMTDRKEINSHTWYPFLPETLSLRRKGIPLGKLDHFAGKVGFRKGTKEGRFLFSEWYGRKK